MYFWEYQNLSNDVNKKMFEFEKNPSTFIWNQEGQNNTPTSSMMFDKSKWNLGDKGDDKSTIYQFFGNTPATAMQGLGSMLSGIGGVYDAYNRNKWQKKAYALEKAAIDRQLERERVGESTLHSVWGN